MLPCADTATVYVQKNSTYIMRKPELSGYTLAGKSQTQDALKVTEAETDITYNYQLKSEQQEAKPKMTPAIIKFLDFVRSTLFSTTFLTPIAEIIP